MRNSILTISFLCAWSCATWQNDTVLNTGAAQTPTAGNFSELKAKEHQIASTTPSLTTESRSCLGIGKFQVSTYTDGKFESLAYYQEGLIMKYGSFDVETKETTTEIEYFYKDNGELDHQKVIRGKDVDVSKEMLLETRQAQKEIQFQCDYLQSKGIRFPLADIVANDLSDLTTIFSVADNYRDFKTETQTDGNQKVIKFIGFNKTNRFHNSPIALLIGNGDFINIKDYELTLENRFPLKEIYRTHDGDLTKTYSYKDEKLIDVVYQFTDSRNQTSSLSKRFEYHEVK